jgi:electron transport complex protein RnfA
MPSHFSLPLIAALLLAAQIIARETGMRSPKNLDEAWGLGGGIGVALLTAIALYWPLSHFVLQPFDLQFLCILVAVLLIVISATITETVLRKKLPGWFPIEGNFQPQIVVGTFILALPLIQDASLAFSDALLYALVFGIGAELLTAAFHVVREHSAHADAPAPLRGAAIDFISAGVLVAALGGIASVF